MQKPWLPFFLFAMMFTLAIPFPDFSTSVVPGWHITILTPYFIMELLAMVILLLVAAGYWKLARRFGKINMSFFFIHLVLSLPAVLIIRAPSLLALMYGADVDLFPQQTQLASGIMIASFALFITSQLVFAIYFIRMIFFKH